MYLDNQKILIASKGIENESFMTMSEVFIDETNHSKKKYHDSFRSKYC